MREVIRKLERLEGEVTSQILKDLIEEHRPTKTRMLKLYHEYNINSLDIHKRRAIDDQAANNMLENAYRTNIIDQVVGYMYGEPIVYQLEDPPSGTTSDNERLWLEEFRKRNQLDDLDARTGKLSSICSYSARLCYMDKDQNPRVMSVPPWEAIFVRDRSVDDTQYAMRYYDMEVNGRERTRVEWYDSRRVTFYLEGDDGNFHLDDSERVNPMPHMFRYVPLIKFKNNDEEKGDFELVRSLIDAYDRLISDAQNVLEDFRAAYMVFEGGDAPEPEDIELMKRTRAIHGPGSVYYLVKEINDVFFENQKETLNKNIYKFAQAVDMDDEAFHSAESGEARKWRLLALENKSITKERKFTQALEEMFKVILSFEYAPPINNFRVTFEFRRNLPIDLQYLGEVAGKFRGIVSDETLLTLLPFVDDPYKEIERIREGRVELPDIEDDEEEEE